MLLSDPQPLLCLEAAAAGLSGAIIGSFVTTTALRGAVGRSALSGRSACDHCGERLSYLQTIPIASFLVARGRCGACRETISPLHIVGEASLAGAAASIVLLAPGQAWLPLFGLASILTFCAVFDVMTLRIPDAANLIIGLLAAALAWLKGDLAASLATGAMAFLVLYGLRQVFAHWRGRTGLGLGDVKMLAAISIWTGPLLSPMALASAAIVGLVWSLWRGPKDEPLAFAPCIALGFWVTGMSAWIS